MGIVTSLGVGDHVRQNCNRRLKRPISSTAWVVLRSFEIRLAVPGFGYVSLNSVARASCHSYNYIHYALYTLLLVVWIMPYVGLMSWRSLLIVSNLGNKTFCQDKHPTAGFWQKPCNSDKIYTKRQVELYLREWELTKGTVLFKNDSWGRMDVQARTNLRS